jgi:phage baseplate assembly protein W
LLNHLNIRQGEKLSDPTFGCIIWEALYEPLTTRLKDAITSNVTNIVNYDPRTRATGVQVSEYESGLQIECTLMYLDYNISEQLRLQFDKSVGLV